jgi:hypothetical protein
MKTTLGMTLGTTLAALVAACGGSVTSLESSTSGAGGGSAANGTGATNGSVAATNGATTGTGTTTGTGGACAGFADEASQVGPILVRFFNDTGMDVFVPGNCSDVDYTIDAAQGPADVSYVYDPSCLQTCEDLQTEPPYACGACAPLVYFIPPGGALETTWNGTGLRYGVSMPAPCYAYPGPGTCSQVVAADSGTYRASAIGWSDCPDCMCNDDGGCFGTGSGLQAYADVTEFQLPGAMTIDVVFGICAFGCAGGG